MLIVETIRKIRQAHYRDHKPLRAIARDFNLSKNTVKKIIRSGVTELVYQRKVQPMPKLAPYKDRLTQWLTEDKGRPTRQRRTALLLFEQLQREGFTGGYDSVRRFVQQWRRSESGREAKAYIPLSFDPGEAFQFDWSHEQVELGGIPVRVKVAHFRLCHSRMPFCVAYLRESLEMVLDAHAKAFEFFGGVCRKGIYDNLKTVVSKVLMGKERVFNRRFVNLASHYLFEPVACTPVAGWEKGQVERQVGVIRQRFFNQRCKFADLKELNQWLADQCRHLAGHQKHPEFTEQTIAEVFAAEQPYLATVVFPFDTYQETLGRLNSTLLVSFDRNHYSVCASAIGQASITIRAYADRIELVADDQVVGSHPRQFGRNKTIYDPWHYLKILRTKPGALRNGKPFKGWELPEPLQQVRNKLNGRPDADKQFVAILGVVLTYGLEAVTDACTKALAAGTVSRDLILNLLSRSTQEPAEPFHSPDHLPSLRLPPIADCQRYDRLLAGGKHAS